MAAPVYQSACASRSINREDEGVENVEVIPLEFAQEPAVEPASDRHVCQDPITASHVVPDRRVWMASKNL